MGEARSISTLAALLLAGFSSVVATTDTVILYTNKHQEGRFLSIRMPSECVTIGNIDNGFWNDNVQSLNTGGNCVLLYQDANCKGRTLALFPGSKADHGDLSKYNFADTMTSMGPCPENRCGLLEDDDDYSDELRRRKRSYNRVCFFDDVFTVGLVAGLALRNPTNGGPVTTIQVNPVNNRVEYVRAEVQRRHLDTGSGTTYATRRFARTMGSNTDQAGHIIASRLGGSGRTNDNIFPQSAHFNMGVFRTEVEDMVYRIVDTFGTATYEVNLQYRAAGDTRPYGLLYRITYQDRDGNTRTVTNDLLNP